MREWHGILCSYTNCPLINLELACKKIDENLKNCLICGFLKNFLGSTEKYCHQHKKSAALSAASSAASLLLCGVLVFKSRQGAYKQEDEDHNNTRDKMKEG